MSYGRQIALTIFAALVLALPAGASLPLRGIFTEYNTMDGMAHNNIHDIHIDSKGYVWLCTWNGVSRFDGYEFHNYCTDPKNMPVRHNRFRSVEEDGVGNLWFRTYDDHIYRFDPIKEEFVDVCREVPQLRDKSHRAGEMICSTTSNHVWVEYQGFGLVGFFSDEENRLQIHNLIDNPIIGEDVRHAVTDGEQNLWIANHQGDVIFVEAQSGTPHKLAEAPESIVAMTICPQKVYFATSSALYLLELSTKSPQPRVVCRPKGAVITTIEADGRDDRIYLGTESHGLYILTHDKEVSHPTDGDIPTRVRDMFVDSHGTVWITDTQNGITRYDPQRDNYKHFEQRQNTVQFYTGYNSVVIERDDRVWIKMNHVGFGYYDRADDSVEPFYNDPTRPDSRMSNGVAIFEVDNNNVLWLSTYYERGLQRIVLQQQDENIFQLGTTENHNHNSSFLDEARALELDSKGNLWVGTKEGNLYCYDSSLRMTKHITRLPNGEPLGPIYTLREDSNGNLWVGTKGNGVYRFRPQPNGHDYDVRHLQHIPDEPNSLSNNQVYCIEEDHDGRIWIATYGGAINMLPSWDSETIYNTLNSFHNYPTEPGERARYLLATEPNRLLIATSEGVILCNPSTSPDRMKFTVAQRGFNEPNTLQANDVLHILKDSEERVWLSTYGGGLSQMVDFDSDGKPIFETFTTTDGLASNIVFSSTESPDGALWLATEKGISRFLPDSGTFTNYSRYEGFRPVVYSEAAAITDTQGMVLFGSADNSLHILDPQQSTSEKYDYRLALTSFQIQNGDALNIESDLSLNEILSQGKTIELKYNYQLFRIGFASLNFRIQDQVSYAYKLEGYDPDWNTTSQWNNVYYSKVPHGKYLFRLKAYVNDPYHTSAEIVLPIHITTPPWTSWWAWTLYVLTAIGLMWLLMWQWLHMAKLRTDARMEQEMSEMKLKFFTNISHELRTPLTLIIGGIEEVKRHQELSERADGALEMSHKNAKRMLSLINQLLDFRKVVKNRMELRVERVDIVTLAKDILDDFRESAAEKHIQLTFSYTQSHMVLWCDPQRIESLLFNLLSNALKFTRNGGRVTLSVSHKEGENEILMSVGDTGIGIPRERVESIFDRFSTYASAVRGEVSGSGIGLALCKEIVELHHGTIEVDSKVGVGTTFTVRLLTGNQHFTMEQILFGDGQEDNTHTDELPHKEVNHPEGARTILLAEDNSQMRLFLYNNLVESYRVVTAEDGQEALEKIESEHPDIVITDLMMPRMDGIELVEKIRKNFETSHLPVIMLTAKQTPEDRILAMKYGADGYITKPFSMELLLARIDNLLTQRKVLFEKMSSNAATNRTSELTPKEVVVTNRDEEFLKRLMEWLEENIENSELTIDLLAGHLRLGRTTMYNKIKSLTGKSPVELIKEYRLTKSELLLRTGQFSVSEVAYKVGFSDPGYFSRCFKEQYKASPVEYLRQLGIKSN